MSQLEDAGRASSGRDSFPRRADPERDRAPPPGCSRPELRAGVSSSTGDCALRACRGGVRAAEPGFSAAYWRVRSRFRCYRMDLAGPVPPLRSVLGALCIALLTSGRRRRAEGFVVSRREGERARCEPRLAPPPSRGKSAEATRFPESQTAGTRTLAKGGLCWPGRVPGGTARFSEDRAAVIDAAQRDR